MYPTFAHLIRLLVIYAVFFATLLRADTLITEDGSHIMGKVLSIEDGSITIETNFAGVLNIPQDQIESIDMNHPTFVEFSGGNTLYGVVSSDNSGTIVLETEGGAFHSEIEKIQAIWHQGEDSPIVKKHKAELAAKELKAKYEINAEVAGTSGNTDSLRAGLGFKAEFENERNKLRLYANYNYDETEDDVSADDAKAGIRFERTFYNDFFWYAHNEIGRDNTEDLDFFNISGAGMGHHFIRNEKQNLSLSAGPAYRYESYGDGTDISVPAGEMSLEHDYKFSFGKVYNDLRFLISLDDVSDYRLRQEFGIEFPIENSDMKIRAGIGNNYHSQPVKDNERLSTHYFTRLVWSWE